MAKKFKNLKKYLKMFRVFKILIVTSLFSLSFSLSLFAANVSGLYNAMVPLEAYRSANSKQVLQQGLLQILIKVTGNRAIAEHPNIADAIENPENYLLKYSQKVIEKPEYIYETDEVITTKQLVSVQNYSENRIKKLLQTADIPLWGRQRPLILFWAMIEFGPKNRIILNDSDFSHFNNFYKNIITQESSMRGIPIAYPLQDLEEQLNISPSVIWAQFPEEIKKASDRYGADVTVSVRFKPNDNQTWEGRWLVMYSDNTIEFETSSNQLIRGIQDGVNWLADNLAKVYTTSLTAPAEQITIKVKNISNINKYVNLDKYLSGLTVVDSYSLSSVKNNGLDIQLNVKNGRKALLDALKLDDKLVEDHKTTQNTIVKYHSLDDAKISEKTKDQTKVQTTEQDILQFRWRS